jgi:hypothetical protein
LVTTRVAGIGVPARTVVFLTVRVTDQPGEFLVIDVKSGVTGSGLGGPKSGSRVNHGGQYSFIWTFPIDVPDVGVEIRHVEPYPLVPLKLVYVPPPAQVTQTGVGGDWSGGTGDVIGAVLRTS